MENLSFSTTIAVDQTPNEVFDAINNPQQWWHGEINGSANNLTMNLLTAINRSIL